MRIKEVELENFRIYRGKHRIPLLPDEDDNIIIVSGKNGYGKTTFLMSLVWCLYGRQMEKVDELYQKEILDKGGYGKYIGNSLNNLANEEGYSRFSVGLTFVDVELPDIKFNEVKVTRSFDVKKSTQESVEILIDGSRNQIIHDLSTENQSGEEIFIRDYILPLEIAKFFFFDAEKIVSLAEANSTEQRKALSKAYSEVLGIHEYEELRAKLEDIQYDYRKKAASPQDKKAFNELEKSIKNKEIDISDAERNIDKLNEEKYDNKYESDRIQETLIKEKNVMTIEQVNELKEEEDSIEKEIQALQEKLKDLFDLIPFGLAGETLFDVVDHLKKERLQKQNHFNQEDVNQKIRSIKSDIEVARSNSELPFDIDIRDFYERQIELLVSKYFFQNEIDLPVEFTSLHDLSDTSVNELENIISTLKYSFKDAYSNLVDSYQRSKADQDGIRRKLRDAEKNSEDEFISTLRDKKESLDSKIIRIENEIKGLSESIGEYKNDLKSYRQKHNELLKKIEAGDEYKNKDRQIEQLISELKVFIIKFKEEKKKSLENKICEGLNTLMHKADFINRVEVDISPSGDYVEIHLFTKVKGKEKKIDKGSLSMGERQMYASALLNALVDESKIKFPVFIDSPMQKFDKDHARSIIEHFYPNVSDQVVILPLIHKELTYEEYLLLKDKVSHSFIIENINKDSSKFISIDAGDLIEKYDELYVPAN